ncbi:ketopantoate reductase family protein [Pseudomonas triticifolii]|uniref:2-dehydropantoate 2-reductase n=1 Tax=Pseudomonas triticifolii TaxID=2762592 RepID=A0ABR7BFK7_9PSED|nr:ketopantoate reductase family protein [Pseudomonas triticifolii]MBC3955949.1 ketopantoate reductase family protein [Pseudomonas triticifolii]
MRILIVGAGAIGGYFGGRLLEAGRQVTFLVRPGRAQALDRDGLVVRSALGNFQYPAPPYVLANVLGEPYDLILLSCKAFDLKACMDAFAPAVGPDTLILSLLNGMAHLERLSERFGAQAVLGGQCLISVDRDAAGAILHLNQTHQLSFGELSGALTPRILRVAESLADAGFEASLSQHIVQGMWDKWCFIATLAAVTASMRAPLCDILSAGGEGLIMKMHGECASIALAAGHPLDARVRQRHLQMLIQTGSTLTASMLRDIERGSPTEVEQILGDMLARRNALGVVCGELSVLEFSCTHVRAYEARRVREHP